MPTQGCFTTLAPSACFISATCGTTAECGARLPRADSLSVVNPCPLILPPNPSMLRVSWEKPPLIKTTETEMDIHDHPISSPTSQLIRNTIRKFRRLSKGSPACSPSGFRIVLISTRRITKTENHYSSWLGGLSVRGLSDDVVSLLTHSTGVYKLPYL